MGKNPHPVPMGRSLRAATSEQQARLLKSCEEISQQIFQSRFFFESNVFLKISKVLAHGGMARPCAVMFLREKFLLWGPPAISHLLPTFGGLRMEAIWSYLLGTAAMARWCQHLNQHRLSKRRTNQYTTSRIPSALQVHHPKFQSPILRPGETYKHHSWHVFKAEDLVFLSGHVVH